MPTLLAPGVRPNLDRYTNTQQPERNVSYVQILSLHARVRHARNCLLYTHGGTRGGVARAHLVVARAVFF